MKIIERIYEYLDFKGIAPTRFEKDISLSNGYLGTQMKRKADLGEGIILKVIENCLDMNPLWLLTGEGEMLRGNEKSPAIAIKNTSGIPLIPIEAIAGKSNGDFTIQESDIEERYVIPELRKADFLIRVKGNSMYPKYNAGDVVAGMWVPKDSFVQWNKPYVVNTTQGIMIKRILKGETKTQWILRSDNKDYQDIDVTPGNDIYSIALVIGTIRLE